MSGAFLSDGRRTVSQLVSQVEWVGDKVEESLSSKEGRRRRTDNRNEYE